MIQSKDNIVQPMLCVSTVVVPAESESLEKSD